MTPEEIANEHPNGWLPEEVAELVRRVVAEEREACAKVCDDWPDHGDAGKLANSIRARGADPEDAPVFVEAKSKDSE